MVELPCLAVGFFKNLVAALFVLSALTLILLVLIQKGRGGGLSGALGGMGAGGVLGSKTGDFLTWVTIIAACMFLLLAVVLAKFYRPESVGGGTVVTQNQPTDANDSGSLDALADVNDGTGAEPNGAAGIVAEVNEVVTDIVETVDSNLPMGVGQ